MPWMLSPEDEGMLDALFEVGLDEAPLTKNLPVSLSATLAETVETEKTTKCQDKNESCWLAVKDLSFHLCGERMISDCSTNARAYLN